MNPLRPQDIWKGIKWLWKAPQRKITSASRRIKGIVERMNSVDAERAPILGDSLDSSTGSVFDDDDYDDVSPELQERPRDEGTYVLFASFFLMCLVLPFLVLASTWSKDASLARRYGGILGAICSLIILNSVVRMSLIIFITSFSLAIDRASPSLQLPIQFSWL